MRRNHGNSLCKGRIERRNVQFDCQFTGESNERIDAAAKELLAGAPDRGRPDNPASIGIPSEFELVRMTRHCRVVFEGSAPSIIR